IDNLDDNYDKYSQELVNIDSSRRRTARFAFNTASFSGRPLWVKFEVSTDGAKWAPKAPYYGVHWYYGSTDHGELGRVYPPKDNKQRTTVFGPFYVNPRTQEPWTEDDITNLDGDGSEDNIGLSFSFGGAITR